MLLAVHGRLASLKIEAGVRVAGALRATFAVHVHHAVRSMLLAVRRRLFIFEVIARYLCAGVKATSFLFANAHHALLSVFLAVRRRLSSFELIVRRLHTGIV